MPGSLQLELAKSILNAIRGRGDVIDLLIHRVAGEFILTPPLVFRTGRDNAAASDRT